ncbi:concanavalin A-like lectin/glucanase domain-containing protein [Microdochium trichocladiopsis]|uniref:Concanavalin A-like lectin/glucanase domain-containing protein n=1 Tax=Microdochium trichocladiopsis TaxID=1682393 RepID=A0A9P8YD92_9PEZI|nr:concanavalin A-like lectin/glucanase domain-containing protein [Microdochium trichocladiopsis]KAH7037099.1 concanavalin A-like lectin/glucanase domain-containing protein [Microdochium trichocladiopsis]
MAQSTDASQNVTPHDPFQSPEFSRAPSSFSHNSYGVGRSAPPAPRYFHSRRVRKEDVEKPWLEKKDPKEKWVTILPCIGLGLGIALSGFLVWDGIRSVVKNNYCPVLDDNFSGGLNRDVWMEEVQVGGFGNGEFEQTTNTGENVYVENGHLFIKPTLQDPALMETNNVINLLDQGICTSTNYYDCVAATNTTAGNSSVVPPTKSGRLITKPTNGRKGVSIKYGRVEVTAKLPKGDWLWPAIWMMPVDDTYGPWPASGEIDIVEARGNNYTYEQGGNNIASSALHWGPDVANDAWWRTNVKRPALHTTYSAGFNTFGLEWSEKYLFTYVNSRLLQVLYTNFDDYLFDRGGFPNANSNGTFLQNPWAKSPNKNAPFDQRFFLILNVAVGGTNGWFQDSKSGKPWLDGSPNAKKDFWNARDTWLPTWTQPAMEISSVKIWQQCNGNEDL